MFKKYWKGIFQSNVLSFRVIELMSKTLLLASPCLWVFELCAIYMYYFCNMENFLTFINELFTTPLLMHIFFQQLKSFSFNVI